MHSMLRLAALASALVLYVASYRFPTYHLELAGAEGALAVLLFGWMAALTLQFAWFANVAVLLGLAFCAAHKVHAARLTATAVFLLSLNTFTLPGTRIAELSGRSDRVASLGTGAYLWVGSMLMFALFIALAASAVSHRTRVPRATASQETPSK
jgi:hypothetical protein